MSTYSKQCKGVRHITIVFGWRWFNCIWLKVVQLHLAEGGSIAFGWRWFNCIWLKMVQLHLDEGGLIVFGW